MGDLVGYHISFRNLLIILIFNCLAAFQVGLLVSICYPDIAAIALTLYENKLANAYSTSYCVSAFFCGVLMYLATHAISNPFLMIILCVPTFILSGFEHSIANCFYCGAAFNFDFNFIDNFALIISAILFNGLGGCIAAWLGTSREKLETY